MDCIGLSTTVMENETEKHMENDMETGIRQGLQGLGTLRVVGKCIPKMDKTNRKRTSIMKWKLVI